MDSLVYSTKDSWGFVGFVKKAESCQKESTNRIHETDLLNTVVRNESTKRIFEHHRWIRKTNPDSWRTNPDFLRNESKLTGYESGFAKRIHVFTNLLYKSRILMNTPLKNYSIYLHQSLIYLKSLIHQVWLEKVFGKILNFLKTFCRRSTFSTYFLKNILIENVLSIVAG